MWNFDCFLLCGVNFKYIVDGGVSYVACAHHSDRADCNIGWRARQTSGNEKRILAR